MAKVGAQRGAELTGKSKSTIQRAMNSGKLSYELDANGRRVIDVSELERVFGLQNMSSDNSSNTVEAELEKASSMLEMERMKMRILMLEKQIESMEEQMDDLRAQRDQWQKQASQVLITSQHSQKQAEELAAELKERERRAKERRQKMEAARLEQRMKKLKAQNENSEAEESSAFSFGGLWKRAKNA
ncbi:MAG: entry exclusion 1 domain-containing protein [Micavibrio sp.]|nr:entry exclusion 1 domain-containing protein [Micavibrio sp.]|tara:strand:+ start:1440 stop:2000 length:561 start_codon:yes stop_codon:yes gene_type:complete